MSELKVYRDPKEGPCWREFYEKSETDKVIAEKDKVIAKLERTVALLHRQCIVHKLRTEELRLSFWQSQREWWESKDRRDTKPLFDYGEKERSCTKLMYRLKKKLEA